MALIGDVGAKAFGLLRAEADLFVSEMRAAASDGAAAGVWIAAGAVILFTAFATALAAVVFLLVSLGFKPHVAAGAMALSLGLVGVLALRHGLAQLRGIRLRPDRTLAQLRSDTQMLKGQPRNA